jgi:hypothetical protein
MPGTALALLSVGEINPQGEQTAILQETAMNTRTSSKLAAFAIALMMNSFIIGGVAYLFDAQTQQHSSLISLTKQIATFQWLI